MPESKGLRMKPVCIQTDQTECYNVSGETVPCEGSGQDGDHRSGMPWPEYRFETSDHTVTDTLTRLMWIQDAGFAEFPLSWQEAAEAVEEMNADRTFGFNNWRLPERRELFSLISHAYVNPSLPKGHPFLNIFPGYYWTATPCVRFPRQAWYIHFGGGRVFKGMKHGSYLVWPVRSIAGESASGSRSDPMRPSESPRAESPHTVTDPRTKLAWTKHAGITDHPVTWSQALDIVREMNGQKAYGYDDWRLPNIRELESITDMTAHSPAIIGRDFFRNIKPFYWSSTTSVYDPAYAWTLYTEDGNIGVGYKANPEFHVWCVRCGHSGRLSYTEA